MQRPDYRGRSIVNLMSTIAARFGGSSPYPTLGALPPEQLAGAEKVVLLLIDGLGYSYLQEHGKGSALQAHLKGKMTSVFPSTTAAAVSSFYTGVAPQNHGIMGWFMYLRELGLVSVILRTTIRASKQSFLTKTITPQKIFQVDSFFNKIHAKGFVVQPNELRPSPYNQILGGNAQHIGHRNLKSLLTNVNKLLRKDTGPTYVMGYYPGFDAIAHKYGVQSPEAQHEFETIDRGVGVFLEDVNALGQKTAIIITADHGLVDCPPERTIWLKQHPLLEQCLAVPLCAESRAAFCYVRPSRVSQFETYVKEHLGHAFTLLSYDELITQEYFGLFEPYPRLFDRVGDYVLVAKENYMIREDLLGEERETLIGHHGGVSEQEMFVPLITAF